MFLIFENVIHVGDFVKVGDVVGVVNNIGVRMTKIQSFGTIISVNNSDLKSMQNLSYADSRISSSISIDNREDIGRVREIIERELPGIDARIRELGYTTTDIIYSGITETNENGFTLRFNAFCVPRYAGRATRMLTEEVISMCQRNGTRLAVRRSTLEKGMEERTDEENRQDQ